MASRRKKLISVDVQVHRLLAHLDPTQPCATLSNLQGTRGHQEASA